MEPKSLSEILEELSDSIVQAGVTAAEAFTSFEDALLNLTIAAGNVFDVTIDIDNVDYFIDPMFDEFFDIDGGNNVRR